MFLSTPPSRVATTRGNGIAELDMRFYPRHPRGWRPDKWYDYRLYKMFLSTPPSRVATNNKMKPENPIKVSIHATLAGGDVLRGLGQWRNSGVSIHATLAGGDRETVQPYS